MRTFATGGKRFYVIDITGFRINPAAVASTHQPPSTAYSVLDRDNMHLEVATFLPEQYGSAKCKKRAHELADRLNREEARWRREGQE